MIRIIRENKTTLRLYRGLENKFDKSYDIMSTDAPAGYSTWTDSLALAKEYAGADGYVYYMDLPLEQLGDGVIDENPKSETFGDRNLFFDNEKGAGINNAYGKEYLVYTEHDDFDIRDIKFLSRGA